MIRRAVWCIPERKPNGPNFGNPRPTPNMNFLKIAFFHFFPLSLFINFFFVTDVTHYWVLGLPKLLVQRLCHSPTQYVIMGSISWQTLTDNFFTMFFVLRWKYFFHISRDWELNPQQGALQHSKMSGALPNCVTMVELSLHKLKN